MNLSGTPQKPILLKAAGFNSNKICDCAPARWGIGLCDWNRFTLFMNRSSAGMCGGRRANDTKGRQSYLADCIPWWGRWISHRLYKVYNGYFLLSLGENTKHCSFLCSLENTLVRWNSTKDHLPRIPWTAHNKYDNSEIWILRRRTTKLILRIFCFSALKAAHLP